MAIVASEPAAVEGKTSGCREPPELDHVQEIQGRPWLSSPNPASPRVLVPLTASAPPSSHFLSTHHDNGNELAALGHNCHNFSSNSFNAAILSNRCQQRLAPSDSYGLVRTPTPTPTPTSFLPPGPRSIGNSLLRSSTFRQDQPGNGFTALAPPSAEGYGHIGVHRERDWEGDATLGGRSSTQVALARTRDPPPCTESNEPSYNPGGVRIALNRQPPANPEDLALFARFQGRDRLSPYSHSPGSDFGVIDWDFNQSQRHHSQNHDRPPSALRTLRSAPPGNYEPRRTRQSSFLSRRTRHCARLVQPYLQLWRDTYDLHLTLFAFGYFAVCTFITCLANALVDRINPNNLVPPEERSVLIDPGMQWFYHQYLRTGLPRDISDWMVRVSAALIFARVLSLQRRACTVFRRTCYIIGTMYLLRAPCVLMTVLPNPLVDCDSRPEKNLLYDALVLFLQKRMSCGDVFFSGHSIFFVVAARIWLQYGSHWVPKLLVSLTATFALVSLIATSYHYSIDVFMATLLINMIYSIYHWVIQGKIGNRNWWGRVILWADGERALDAKHVDLGVLPPLPTSRPISHFGQRDYVPIFDYEADVDSHLRGGTFPRARTHACDQHVCDQCPLPSLSRLNHTNQPTYFPSSAPPPSTVGQRGLHPDRCRPAHVGMPGPLYPVLGRLNDIAYQHGEITETRAL